MAKASPPAEAAGRNIIDPFLLSLHYTDFRNDNMNKITAVLISALMAAACSGLNPFGLDIKYEDFDLEGQIWAVSGFKGPYGQQEIGRMHYKDADDNLIAAEFSFKDGKATVVFPSGPAGSAGATWFWKPSSGNIWLPSGTRESTC